MVEIAGTVELTLFQGPDFSGTSQDLSGTTFDLQSVNFDNITSSIEVKRGVWTVYTDKNFGGTSLILSPGKYNRDYLNKNIGDNTISSARPTVVILYRDYNFTGYNVKIAEQVSSLDVLYMNNTISCVEVTAGECTVFVDNNYSGKSAKLKMGQYDQTAITSMIGNDVISSLRLTTSI